MFDPITYVLSRRYTERYVTDALSGILNFEYRIVDELPTTGEKGIIYLVPTEGGTYDEYVWSTNKWIKIKDGTIAELIVKGYYAYGVFWKEEAHINRYPDQVDKIYLDVPNRELYYYNPSTHVYEAFLQKANEIYAGIVKLYKTTGNNEDGTITQKKITEELEKKAVLDTSKLDEECLGFKGGHIPF